MSKVYTIVVKGQRFDFTQADLDAIKKGEVTTETQKKIVHVFTSKGRIDVGKQEFDNEIKKGILANMSPEELEELENALPPKEKEVVESTAEQVLDKPVEDNINPQTDQEMQGQAEQPGEQIATTNANDPQERLPEEEEKEEDVVDENGEVIEEPQDESAEEVPEDLETGEFGGSEGEEELPEEEPQEDVEESAETPEEAKPLQVVCPHCKGQVDTSVEPGGVPEVPEAPVEPEEAQVPGPLRQPGQPVEPTFGLPAMKGVSVTKVSSDGSLQKIWCDDPKGHMEIINKAEQGSKRGKAGRIAGAAAGLGAIAALAHPATRRAGIKRLRQLGGKIKTYVGKIPVNRVYTTQTLGGGIKDFRTGKIRDAIGASKPVTTVAHTPGSGLLGRVFREKSAQTKDLSKDFSIAEIIDMLEFASPVEQQELIKYLVPEELNDIMELFDKVDQMADIEKDMDDTEDVEKYGAALVAAGRGALAIGRKLAPKLISGTKAGWKGTRGVRSRAGLSAQRAGAKFGRTRVGRVARVALPVAEGSYLAHSLGAFGKPKKSYKVVSITDVKKKLDNLKNGDTEKGLRSKVGSVVRRVGNKLINIGLDAGAKAELKRPGGALSRIAAGKLPKGARRRNLGIKVGTAGARMMGYRMKSAYGRKKRKKVMELQNIKKELKNLRKRCGWNGITEDTEKGIGSAARAVGRKIRSIGQKIKKPSLNAQYNRIVRERKQIGQMMGQQVQQLGRIKQIGRAQAATRSKTYRDLGRVRNLAARTKTRII
ncbi:MAG: hypothetical protein E2O29_02150 [Deltaproteobacteria bacterium]|nr:MAG: hypothetical protein E2O29_02150 [Deltaproteobacteria bacterium]